MESPNAFVTIQNFFAITVIINRNNKPSKITVKKPFDIEILNLDEVSFLINGTKKPVNRVNPEQDELLKENFKNLRLEHCNDGKRKTIQNLYYKYRDICCEDVLRVSLTKLILSFPRNPQKLSSFRN